MKLFELFKDFWWLKNLVHLLRIVFVESSNKLPTEDIELWSNKLKFKIRKKIHETRQPMVHIVFFFKEIFFNTKKKCFYDLTALKSWWKQAKFSAGLWKLMKAVKSESEQYINLGIDGSECPKSEARVSRRV